MIKETTICDKCGKETLCTVEDFICFSEKDNIPAGKKEKYSTTIKYLASVTSHLCDDCSKKRRNNYFMGALFFFISSLPFLIWWMYLELGLTLLVVSAAVLFLSSKGHEMEYIAKIKYREMIEGKEGVMLNPRIIKKERWEVMKKDPAKFNSVMTEEENAE
jgi:hypothetical protein